MSETLTNRGYLALRLVEANLHNLADITSVVVLACRAADATYDEIEKHGWTFEDSEEET